VTDSQPAYLDILGSLRMGLNSRLSIPIVDSSGLGFEIAPRAAIDAVTWDAFVDESPDAWLFHTNLWLAAATVANDDLSFAVLSPQKTILAIVSVWNGRAKWLRAITLPDVSNRRAGIAHHPGLDPSVRQAVDSFVLATVRKSALTARAVLVNWELPSFPPGPDCPTQVALAQAGYSVTSWPAKVLDLSESEESLWKGYRKGCRSVVRRAERLGIDIVVARNPRDIGVYARMHRETMSRSGSSGPGEAAFVRLWEGLSSVGNAECLLAYLPFGEPVAGIVTFRFKNLTYYHSAASASQHLDVGGNSILLHHAILRAKANGDRFFHLGPTPRRDQVSEKMYLVGRFKNQFGGFEVPWRSATLALRPNLLALIRLASRSAAVLRRLPIRTAMLYPSVDPRRLARASGQSDHRS
jgi:hypothetical protein